MKTHGTGFTEVYAHSNAFPYDLSVNINPLGPTNKLQILRKFISCYPGNSYAKLIAALCKLHIVNPKQIALGAGLDGLLHDFILCFLKPGEHFLMPEVTFQNPCFSAALAGGIVKKIPMNNDLSVDFEALSASLVGKESIIFLCHPNNPTGLLEDLTKIKQLLKATKALVIIDEANIEYTSGPSCLSLLSQFSNLVVMRSFSKAYGLAGMRIGYSLACEHIHSKLHNSRPPFNVSGIASEMAIQALEDQKHLADSLKFVKKENQYLSEALKGLNYQVIPSDSNTLLVRLPLEKQMSVKEFIQNLNALNCHVVHGAYFNLPEGFFRIAPRSRDINENFINALKHITLQQQHVKRFSSII
ncbi:MAG: histidinol-phosphate aminotransferase family protein [Parachlamydiales bacterium]|nr:histidinol-phosphate aminotransferase family protein [Parachlamydiales bacterium]